MSLHSEPGKCFMTPSNTMVLPAGRLSYPHLFKPRAMPGESEDKAKYSTSFMMPPTVDLKPALAWVNKAAQDKWGVKALEKLRRPFLKHEEKTTDLELAKAFPYLVRCATINKPTVVFGSGEPCVLEEETYAGRWARISVRIFVWEHIANGRGVSFGLSNVMLLDHDERIGGGRANVEDEFGTFFTQPNVAGNGKGSGANPDNIFD